MPQQPFSDETFCARWPWSLRRLQAWRESHQEQDSVVPHPELVYQLSGWIDWADWLGTGRTHSAGRKPAKRPAFWPFEEARAWVQRQASCLRLRSAEDWRVWVQAGHRPPEVPSEPWRTYAKAGWVSWADWLQVRSVHTYSL